MSTISSNDLQSIVAGDRSELDVHLSLIEKDVQIEGKKIRIHCHCLTVDGNGRVSPRLLAEFLRNSIADYAIPKSRMQAARNRDIQFKSSSATSALHHEAISTFTDLANTGEGGEMLLYILAERFLGLPLVLCKMDLKTDSRMHYHGADGVYASVTDEGLLKLFWGESKIYKDATTAIRDCLSSLAPFLVEEEHQGASRGRDLLLLSDKADLNDPKLTLAFKKFFDKTSPLSKRVEYCGVALVGFNVDFYSKLDQQGLTDYIAETAKSEMKQWLGNISNRLVAEKLESFDIQFMCVPVPCAEGFRKAFLEALGIKDAT
jgi:Cap4 SAVED domain